MAVVSDAYKLIDLFDNGEERQFRINTRDAWNVFEISTGTEKSIVINEGDYIKFTINATGEIKEGIVSKLIGKGDKAKIQLQPSEEDCEEIWEVGSIEEGTLVVVKNREDIENLED